MKREVLLGWLEELEMTVVGHECPRDGASAEDAPPSCEHWRVFAALAAASVRAAGARSGRDAGTTPCAA